MASRFQNVRLLISKLTTQTLEEIAEDMMSLRERVDELEVELENANSEIEKLQEVDKRVEVK